MKQSSLLSYFGAGSTGSGASRVRKCFDAMYEEKVVAAQLTVAPPSSPPPSLPEAEVEGAVVPNLDLQGPGVKENRDGGEEAPQVASPGAAEADPTSDYEALRRERIEKNREAMRRLVASSGVGVADPRPKKKPRPARRPQPHQESRPLRRSRRFKDQEPNGVGEEAMGAPRDEDLREEEEEVVLTSTAVTAADYHLSFEG